MSHHYPRIRVYAKDGRFLIREGLSLCFYMHRPHVQLKQAVMQSLDTFLRIVGPQALGLYTDEEGDWQNLDDAAWEHLRKEMAERRGLIIELQDAGGREPGFAFDYHGKPIDEPFRGYKPEEASAVSFWLPTEYLEEHGPGHVRDLALEIATSLPFTSGNVGLSFNSYPYHLGVRQALREHCFRYPGMDIYNLSTYSSQIGTRVRGPTWMNFLGPTVLREVGGVEALQAKLHSPGTTVQPLSGGRAVITLGPQPEAGDTEQGHLLPAYRELARVLEPWLFHEKNRIDASFPAEDMLRWERRFLD